MQRSSQLMGPVCRRWRRDNFSQQPYAGFHTRMYARERTETGSSRHVARVGNPPTQIASVTQEYTTGDISNRE